MRPIPIASILLALTSLAWAQPAADANRNLGAVTRGGQNDVRVVAFGDWGYRGRKTGQDRVAAAVAKAHAAAPFHLGLTLGDNFYPSGVASTADALWSALWENVYAKLGIPFFATLGNHDYAGNEQAQVEYVGPSKTWRMPHRYYTFTAGPVQFFALDTDEGNAGAFLFKRPWSDAQAKWLADELSKSKARWKVVYGHHPIYSDGHHGDSKRLIAKLLPILQGKVQLYICGHEHELQVHDAGGGVKELIVGGGGKNLRKVTKRRAEFAESSHGFLELSATPERLDWRLTSVDGKPLATATVQTRTVPASQPR